VIQIIVVTGSGLTRLDTSNAVIKVLIAVPVHEMRFDDDETVLKIQRTRIKLSDRLV